MNLTLFLVVDSAPCELANQLIGAAQARALEVVVVRADQADSTELPQLGSGDLLYRAGVSHRARLAEQLLCGTGVATFYDDALGPHRLFEHSTLMLSRLGIPVPASIYALPPNDDQLRTAVKSLGGLPVILKRPGHSLGNGVMRLDSWTSLVSVVDAFRETLGDDLVLMANVAPAVHWRCLVVGDRVVASYENPLREGDFRTCVDEADSHRFRDAPALAIEVAIRATHALGLGFGGVDVLVHESGQVYVLEVNFPAYFAHPMRAVGVDVAGFMVDELVFRAG